jgi:hypothetical protein
MQFVGGLSEGYLLYLDNIRKEPRKRILKEDVTTLYLYHKSEHLIPLQKIITKEISKNKNPLIYPEKIHQTQLKASKP